MRDALALVGRFTYVSSGSLMAIGPPPRVLLNDVRKGSARSVVFSDVLAFHERLPGYELTPLVDSPRLAERLGVAKVMVKVESRRLGLPAFKMLGASWAAYRAVVAQTGVDDSAWMTISDFTERLKPFLPLTFATATDGNHGRAVARIARLFGIEASIWIPEGTADARILAIESEGATCIRVDGTFDEAVALAAKAADDRTLVVSDTSWPGYEDVPRWVVEGYSTMVHEIDTQIATSRMPTPSVVAVPVGVGSLAAAIIAHYRAAETSPVIIGAEPTAAACVLAALEAGEVVTVPGPHTTEMVGMACGIASALAMEQIASGMGLAVSFDDEWAFEAMRLLADEGIVAGATGAASLGVLLSLVDCRPDLAGTANLGSDDIALVIVTEGATDPRHYQEIVGTDSTQVAAS